MKDMLSCPSCVPPGGGHATLRGSSVFPASSDDEQAAPAHQTMNFKNEEQIHICQLSMKT